MDPPRWSSHRENVKLNVEETAPVAAENAATEVEKKTETSAEGVAEVAAEAAEKPVRRRAPRRASSAAGAPEAIAEAPAEESAPASTEPATAAETAAEEPEAPKKRVSRSRKKVAEPEVSEAPAATETEQAAPEAKETAEEVAEAPKKRVTRTRKKAEAAPAAEADGAKAEVKATEQADAAPAETGATAASTEEADAEEPAAKAPATRGRRRSSSAAAKSTDAGEAAEAATETVDPKQSAKADLAEELAKVTGTKTTGSKADAGAAESAQAGSETAEQSDASDSDAEKAPRGRTNRRTRTQKSEQSDAGEQSDAQSEPKTSGDDRGEKNSDRNDKGGSAKNGESPRSSRTRQRDRKRRGQSDEFEPEIAEDDVLLPIAGILDVLDNYAFVRTSGYLPGTSDVYVSLGQVKKYGMRRGDAVVGAIRQPREGENSSRQKYNAIVRVDSINGRTYEENGKRTDIADLVPIHPQQPLKLSGATGAGLGAEIDRIAPIGLGQRALMTVPAATPASQLLAGFADAVSDATPNTHLMLVLTEARPEDVTELQRSVRGEVIAASFERPTEDQTTIAELAIDRARRLVEMGHDVVVLLDSLTNLADAYVLAQQGSRSSAEAQQAQAIAQVKRLFAAARNVENGGSLTVLATARTKTGVVFHKDLVRAITPAANTFIKISGSRVAPEVKEDASYTLGVAK